MRRRFDIDDQRGAICAFGLVCLAIELIGYYLTGKIPPTELTTVFATLAAGPWVSFTWQKAVEYRRGDPPPPPPSSPSENAPPPIPPPDGSQPPRKRKARGPVECVALAS